MHVFSKFLVVDPTRKPPHGHTIGTYDTFNEALAEQGRYNAGKGAEHHAHIVTKKVQEN